MIKGDCFSGKNRYNKGRKGGCDPPLRMKGAIVMTKLYHEKMQVRCVDLGRESSLPMLYEVNTQDKPTPSVLPEGDGLYLQYRFVKSAFPYRAQDNYTRDYVCNELDSIVLENEYLKASFVPSQGGKLWSLFDKVAGMELLFANPVMRPAYLATRNAWCSGGVEWNCGILGHHPFTCEQLFTATLTGPEGEPILRMYEYERIRGVVYQMDFSLPAGSKVLFARMRVVNPSFRDTAMYWWSNIAVPEVEHSRVVVPADDAYTTVNGAVTVVPTPIRDGVDVTYPENNPVSVDYFFRTIKERRKYTCQLSPEGYGLFEASTSLLKGRKIFVWGQGPGGKKWQEYLSGEGNNGRYCEIQCGLAYSQYECLPMPPATAWEWLEIYGAMNADGEKVHGAWVDARAEVEARIDDIVTAEALEKRLEDTREYALRPAEKLLYVGSGWGALENLRREKAGLSQMCSHLDFGPLGEAQESWTNLLNNGTMGEYTGEEAPRSWMRQKEWTALMEEAANTSDKENWYTLLQLGSTWLAEPDLMRAEYYLNRSLSAKRTAWGVYAMAELKRIQGKEEEAVMLAVEAANLMPTDGNLAKMAARMLHKAEAYEKQIAFVDSRSEEIQELPRIRLYHAFALAYSGDVDGAEALIYRDGRWLEVPDIQEGELSLSELWYRIQEVRAEHEGKTLDRDAVSPPYAIDFRMFAKK